MAPVISVKDEGLRRLLVLVAAASGVADTAVIKLDEGLSGDCQVDGDSTTKALALLSLVKSSPASKAMLGLDEKESEEQVKQAVEKYATAQLKSQDLGELNKSLETKTFLVGNQLSLADLVTYSAAAPALSLLKPDERPTYVHALRWYDHIGNTVDSTGLFPWLDLALREFVAPAPPPAPAAPAAAKKGGQPAEQSKKASPSPESKPLAKDGAVAGEGKKKEKKEKKPAAETTPAASDEPTVDFLDLRVGKVLDVKQHPNAESLYVETIDLGEEAPRQIVSGLVKFVPLEKMKDRFVVVVTNLKPAKMRDVMSYGMVLCASNDAHDAVDPVIVPEGVLPGEKISFEGYTREAEAQLNPRKKQFEKIAPHLVVSPDGICTYKGIPFMTSRGPVTATIPGAHIA